MMLGFVGQNDTIGGGVVPLVSTSLPVYSEITINSVSTNADIYFGFYPDLATATGAGGLSSTTGYILEPGKSVTIPVGCIKTSNLDGYGNAQYIFVTTQGGSSGGAGSDVVSFFGV